MKVWYDYEGPKMLSQEAKGEAGSRDQQKALRKMK